MKKILIMGLPGAGKTTLATELAKMLNAVHFNADEIRKEINKDLTFSIEDRIEQARRMKVLCDIVVRSGNYAIADFVCPTKEAQEAFITQDTYVVWVDRTKVSRYEDTNKLFHPPENFDMIVNEYGSPKFWALLIVDELQAH
jgi:adenylylsulfate kinase-like enzyme